MDPLSKKIYLELPKPRTGDVTADKERLLRELTPMVGNVELPYAIFRRDYRAFREQDWNVTATLVWTGNSGRSLPLSRETLPLLITALLWIWAAP